MTRAAVDPDDRKIRFRGLYPEPAARKSLRSTTSSAAAFGFSTAR